MIELLFVTVGSGPLALVWSGPSDN